MVQRSREEEQKQQHIGRTENILLKRCTTEGIQNNDQKPSGKLDSSVSWNSLLSGTFLARRVFSWQLRVFEIPELKEFHEVPLSFLPDDFWP